MGEQILENLATIYDMLELGEGGGNVFLEVIFQILFMTLVKSIRWKFSEN